MSIRILNGDCRQVLKTLPDESVHCVVTSPPYFGLRDYGVDGQIGLEATPDAFVAEMVAVFREVRRVLRSDGTLWLNLGDSYAAQRGGTRMPAETLAGGVNGRGDASAHRGRGGPADHEAGIAQASVAHRNASAIGLKHKDLIGIPWRVAFALRADGWWLRQDIIWSKPNPMPESVADRCTKAHEYLFLLTKAERYYFDAGAIKEQAIHEGRVVKASGAGAQNAQKGDFGRTAEGFTSHDTLVVDRNKRSVWTVATQPFKEAHFATFPPALIEPCIKAGCPEGGTVLDPFGGAGTTGLVADRLKRNAILIELNPEYAAMAEKRIKGESPLFAEVAA